MAVALKEKLSNTETEDDLEDETDDVPLENELVDTGEIRNIASILDESNLPEDEKHRIMAIIQKKRCILDLYRILNI